MAQIKFPFVCCPRFCVNSTGSAPKFFASIALAVLVSASIASAKHPHASPSPSPSPGTSASANASPSPASDDDFQIPVPMGVPVKGITIPHYDEKGKLVMTFNAEVARKVDPEHIEMQNLKIDGVSDDGKKYYIEMPQSVFNLQTRVLNGHENVLIRRDDFVITGDAGEFETKTRFARVLGNIKMTIFNTENLVK